MAVTGVQPYCFLNLGATGVGSQCHAPVTWPLGMTQYP